MATPTNVVDPSIVTEQHLRLKAHGEFKLVELTRSRKRKFRAAMDALEKLDGDETDEGELESVRQIGLAIEATTEGSDGVAEKLVADYENDQISDGFLARSLQSVMKWEQAQQQLGND